MWRCNWFGIPDCVSTFPQLGRFGRELLQAVEREIEAMLEKPVGRKLAGAEGGGIEDAEWFVNYPTLYDHLTQTKWPDGTARELSTVTLFADGGVVKVLLKDRALGHCLWAASKTFSDVFAVLEGLLNDPGADWREDRNAPGKKASRVNK